MILVTIKAEEGLRLGVRTEGGIVDVAAALDDLGGPEGRLIARNLQGLFVGGDPLLRDLQAFVEKAAAAHPDAGWLLPEGEIELGPVVPSPGKIICIGLNYRKHAVESGMEIPKEPILFSKFSNALAGSGEPIPLPAGAKKYDYEAELGVVVGRRSREVPEEQALDHVFGYCNANDLSARDLQFRSSQWLLGKTLDKFLPLGPYLVTADQLGDPQKLDIRCWVNGEKRQESNTADMIFSVAQLIAYVSRYFTLEAGDLLITGTPSGVIAGMPEKVWLTAGDEVDVEIEGLGRLSNRLA